MGGEIEIHAAIHESSSMPIHDLHHSYFTSQFRVAPQLHQIPFTNILHIAAHHLHRRAHLSPLSPANLAAVNHRRPNRRVPVKQGSAAGAELEAPEIHVVEAEAGDDGHVQRRGRVVAQVFNDDV